MATPAQNISNIAGFQTAKPAFDPRREYFAPAFAGTAPRAALPIANDDVTKQLSYDIYSQMRCDPEIAKCLTLLVISTLGDKYELLPSHPEKASPTPQERTDHEESLKWRDFCWRNIEGLQKPFRATLEDQLMGALSYGHKIAEKIWKIQEGGEDDGKLMLDALKIKSRKSVRFVVDRFFNVVGFVGVDTLFPVGQDPYVGARELLPLGSFTIVETPFGVSINDQEIIPREKFVVLAVRVEDEDPRGRSILRPAFNSWHLKKDTFPQYLRYLLLTALPLLIGILPENEGGKQLLRDLKGEYVKDPATGQYIEVSPTEALATELLKLRDGSVIALKGGSELKLVEAKGDGSVFHKAFEMFDKQMEMSILLQTLATSDAKYNTRAASMTHMTVLDQLVWWLKGCVVDMVTSDILQDIIRYNGGEELLKYTPRIHFGDTERRDFAKDGQTIAALMRANFFSPSQLKKLDAQLGAPERAESEEEIRQVMEEMRKAMMPNRATQLPNGAVSNPAVRSPQKSTAKFPKPGPTARVGR